MSIPTDNSCVRIGTWDFYISTADVCGVSHNHGDVVKSFKF